MPLCSSDLYYTRYHLRPIRMAVIEKTSDGKDLEKREPLYSISGNVHWFSHMWKTVWSFLKNYDMIEQSYFWVFIGRNWNHYFEIYLPPLVHFNIFIIIKSWKLYPSKNEHIKKMWHTHAHTNVFQP